MHGHELGCEPVVFLFVKSHANDSFESRHLNHLELQLRLDRSSSIDVSLNSDIAAAVVLQRGNSDLVIGPEEHDVRDDSSVAVQATTELPEHRVEVSLSAKRREGLQEGSN